MKKFNEDLLLGAAQIVAQTVEREWLSLNRLRNESQLSKQLHWKTEFGEVLISGKEDDHYTKKQLEKLALLIDFGGKNSYEGPVAGARTGQIKIIIDFAEDVTIASTQTPVSAGAGVFGVGFLYLPNPQGSKSILTGHFSQGMGLCGVGGCFLNGKGTFKAQRYAQGAGSFGVGIFSNTSGDSSLYETHLYGQGVGFTKGMGIFRHRGSDAILRAGLVDPDPRESLGMTSLCQGVGYGIRGYVGGGIGLCVLKGDRLNLESSYFAQGSGYWHAAGAFYLEGSSNSIKARRYDQGSGIHSAAGAFFLAGNNNHIMNWGVGPAFGWDTGLGWAMIFGNQNRAQAEWGAGTASINSSRSFSFFSGNKNTLDLPGLGTANMTRDLADYSLSAIEGEENSLKNPKIRDEKTANQSIFISPWGTIQLEGVRLKSDAGSAKIEWKSFPRETSAEKEKINLQEELDKAQALPPPERVERLVQIASAFAMDKAYPRKALARLVSLPDAEIPHLIASFDPADFDQAIQIRAVISILGEIASKAILQELEKASGEGRAGLLSLLALMRSNTSIPVFLDGLQDPDWRIRTACIRLLGMILNRSRGSLPGRRVILRTLEQWSSTSNPSKSLQNELLRQLASRTFAESASLLSAVRDHSLSERLKFLESAPEDISGNMSEDQALSLLNHLQGQRKEFLKTVRQELRACDFWQEQVRQKLIYILKTTTPLRKEETHALLIAVGNLGNKQDAALISKFLNSDSALLREASSISLGRLGKGALPYLEKALQSHDPQSRIQALCSLASTSDPQVLSLLKRGLEDQDSLVRRVSLSLIQQLQYPFSKDQKRFLNEIEKSGAKNPQTETELEKLFLYGGSN